MTSSKKPFFNERHKCIPMEDYTDGEWLTFNYNPEDQPLQAAINAIDPFSHYLADWCLEQHKFFSRLKNCSIECYLEPSPKGRLHFHGRIRLDRVVKFYLVDLPRLQACASYEIDHISDTEVWDEYVLKNEERMKEFCELESIAYSYKNFVDI